MQVDNGEMTLDLRHNFNQIKSEIKYKYLEGEGNPASLRVFGNVISSVFRIMMRIF